MTTKLTSLRRQAESSKSVKDKSSKSGKTEKRLDVKEEKQKVTLHLPLDVIEHLMLGKARREGSMSDQVAQLVREKVKSNEHSQS